jgi:hypothetical protein
VLGVTLTKLSQNLVHSCRPIVIAAKDSQTGNRLGGHAPTSCHPAIRDPKTVFFATFIFDQSGQELSIFLAQRSQYDVLKHARQLMAVDAGPVALLLHSQSCRSPQIENASNLSGHRLIVEGEIKDPGENSGAPDHKIGGKPYYHHNYGKILKETEQAIAVGYIHMLQLSFPGYHDANVRGAWPFGEYVFHIFGKPGREWQFLCGWA